MTDALLDVDDVAAILNCPRRTAYEYIRQMTRVVLSGGARGVRVSREALDAWTRARTRTPEAPAGFASPASSSTRAPVALAPLARVHVTQPRRRRA